MNIQPAVLTSIIAIAIAAGIASASIAIFGVAFGILVGAGLGAIGGIAATAVLAPSAPAGNRLDQPSIIRL